MSAALAPEVAAKAAQLDARRQPTWVREPDGYEPATENPITRLRWTPLDLASFVTGDQDESPAVLGVGDFNLFYGGRLNLVMGESESLKTWLALVAVRDEITSGKHVVFIDYEDTAKSIVGRLLALGVSAEAILKHLSYLDAPPQIDETARTVLAEIFAGRGMPSLVVIDGNTEAIAACGLDPDKGVDVATFYNGTPRHLADTGAAVVMIDHVVKDREGRGRWAIGSERKISGLDGAAYTVDLVQPFGRERTGKARLLVSKDRQGYVRQHEGAGRLIAVLELRSWPDGGVTCSLSPPAAVSDDAAGWRPTHVMEKVSKAIEAHAGLSKNSIRSTVGGKAATVDLALELLISEGYVKVDRGPRGAQQHASERPFRAAADEEI